MGKLLIIFLVCFNINGIGQVNALSDTIFDGVQNLDSVLVTTRWSADKINAMPSVRGTFLYSGKKTEQIFLTGTNADVANKSARQVFAKIPGVFVYDMDGAGNQLNISMRGWIHIVAGNSVIGKMGLLPILIYTGILPAISPCL